MSKRRPWVKLWCDALDSRKLSRVGDHGELLFYRLLMLAGECGGSGIIPDGSAEDIAWRFRMDEDDAERALKAIHSVGLIQWDGHVIQLVSWADRQSADTDAERASRYRASKASRDRHATVTLASRDRHERSVLEEEEEGDTEEEQSFESKVQPVPARATPRAQTPIPPDWLPNASHQSLADDLRLDLSAEAAAFAEHARAKASLNADWNAAFRLWLNRSRQMGRARGPNAVAPRAVETRSERIMRAGAEALAELRAANGN